MPLTISDKKISLWIAGNQFHSKGFENLVLIQPQFPPLTFEGAPGMDANPYYFVINTGENYTQYTLVCNKVVTNDGDPEGVLKISIAIPKNHRIVGGFTTPFEVLAKLRQFFTDNYMDPTPGVKEGWTYKADKPETTHFANILNGYNLEEIPMVHRPMKGTETGLLVLKPQDIKQLMKDVQYEEFTPFKEVAVATFADESLYGNNVIRGIEVPRKRHFTLYVNGEQKSWPVRDIFNDFISLKSEDDERYYNNRTLSFSLNDLMSGKTYREIDMDLSKEEIHVTLSGTPKRVAYRIDLEGTDNERHRVTHVKIFCNGKPVPVLNGQFELVGEDIQYKNNLGVEYDGDDYKIVEKKWYGDKLRLTMQPVERPKAAPAPAPAPAPKVEPKPEPKPAPKAPEQAPTKPVPPIFPSATTNPTPSRQQTAPKPHPQNPVNQPATGSPASIIVEGGSQFANARGWKLIVNCAQGERVLSDTIMFTRDNSGRGKRGSYISLPIELPASFVGQTAEIYIESETERTNVVEKAITAGENVVMFTDFEPISDYKKYIPMALAALAALIVGLFIGWLIGRPGSDSKAEDKAPADTTEVITYDPATTNAGSETLAANTTEDKTEEKKTEEQKPAAPAVKLDFASLKLDDKAISFQQIKDYASQLSALKSSNPDAVKANQSKADQIEALNKLVTAIEKKNVDDIKSVVEDKKSPINKSIKWSVREIYKGWKDGSGYHEYTAEGIKEATKEFKSGKYTTFDQLTKLHDGKGEYKAGSEKLNKNNGD